MENIKILFNEEKNRTEAFDSEDLIGFCEYKKEDDILNIIHTEVNAGYEGKGIAGKLIDKLVEVAEQMDKKIIPTCPFAVKKFDEDDKYKDVDGR